MKIVFVIPVFNEEKSLAPLAEGISTYAAPYEHEILFVDDGSTDGSFEVIQTLRERYPTVRAIRLRRNQGKSLALAAAFQRIEGDVAVMMDADLQDDPEEIPRLLEKLDEGYDLVCGWKQDRNDPWHKTFPSRIYNAAISRQFNIKLHDINTGFKAMRMEVAKRLPLYGDMHRMIVVHATALGYRVTEVPVKHHPRRYGKSHYGIERFIRGLADAYTTRFLTQSGHAPNHVFFLPGLVGIGLGALMTIIGMVLLGLGIFGPPQLQQPTFGLLILMVLILAIVLAAWGSISIMIGLLGELIIHHHEPADLTSVIEEEWLDTK
jgi:glycosyltransferase involved in cell wall biosynthesis